MCLRRFDMGERLWLLLQLWDRLLERRRWERELEREWRLRELRWERDLDGQTHRQVRQKGQCQQRHRDAPRVYPSYRDLDLDLDLDREWDLDLEWWEVSLERAGERLVDVAEPWGDRLLEAGREPWTGQILGVSTTLKPKRETNKKPRSRRWLRLPSTWPSQKDRVQHILEINRFDIM